MGGAFPSVFHIQSLVSITDNQVLTEIGTSTFPLLIGVDAVLISHNSNLESLHGAFPRLKQARGAVRVAGNSNVQTVSRTFPSLEAAHSLFIQENSGSFVLDDTAFSSLTEISDNLYIEDNSGLLNMSGCFPKLAVIKDDLHVKRNDKLVALDYAFPQLTAVQVRACGPSVYVCVHAKQSGERCVRARYVCVCGHPAVVDPGFGCVFSVGDT